MIWGVKTHWIDKFFMPLEFFLRHKCLNWARMIHLNTYNTSYGRKKGRKSKCQFDSQPLKSRNCLELCAFRWHATYCWRDLDEVTTLLQTSLQLEVYTKSYKHSQWWESQFWEFQDSQLGSPRKNDIWVQLMCLVTKNTMKGKVVASPKSRLWWILWVYICPWFVCAPKMF